MLKDKKILIVDDDADIREFCEVVLTKESAKVVCAASSAEGLAMILSDRPDLVVLDIMMEEADSGFKLAHKLAEEFKDLPILMLSSIAGASAQIFDTASLPVSELLDKPIHHEDLIRIAKRLIEKNSKTA